MLLVLLAAMIGHYSDQVEDENPLPGCRTVMFNTKFQNLDINPPPPPPHSELQMKGAECLYECYVQHTQHHSKHSVNVVQRKVGYTRLQHFVL